MVAKFKLWAGIAAGVLMMLLLAFLKGRSTMKEEVEAEQKDNEIKETKAVADKQVVAATTAKEVHASVSSISDAAVDDGLQRFTRD